MVDDEVFEISTLGQLEELLDSLMMATDRWRISM
jgi:hypothetical protein